VVSILFHISTSEAEVDKRKKERDGEREIGHVRYMRKNPLLPPGSKTHPSKKTTFIIPQATMLLSKYIVCLSICLFFKYLSPY
jgi:hypothetical protein